MPNTEYLYTLADTARIELAALDREIAECKDACRAAIARLMEQARLRDPAGRCFGTILDAIDDVVFERRDAIRARVEEADIEIDNAERAA